MTQPSIQRTQAIEFLKAHPELQMYGAKRLLKVEGAPTVGRKTWERAREALNLPPAPRAGINTGKPAPTKKSKRFDRVVTIDYSAGEITTQWGDERQSWPIRNLKALTPENAIVMYESQGYVVTFSSEAKIQLEKRTTATKARAAA